MYDAWGAVHKAHNREALAALLSRDELQVQPAEALPYGYYAATFGEEYGYYEASTLSSGRFLGQDLHRKPPRLVRAFLKARRRLLELLG